MNHVHCGGHSENQQKRQFFSRGSDKKINLDYRETFETEITPSTIAADFDDEMTYLVPALVYFYLLPIQKTIDLLKKRRESEKLFVFTPLSSS